MRSRTEGVGRRHNLDKDDEMWSHLDAFVGIRWNTFLYIVNSLVHSQHSCGGASSSWARRSNDVASTSDSN